MTVMTGARGSRSSGFDSTVWAGLGSTDLATGGLTGGRAGAFVSGAFASGVAGAAAGAGVSSTGVAGGAFVAKVLAGGAEGGVRVREAEALEVQHAERVHDGLRSGGGFEMVAGEFGREAAGGEGVERVRGGLLVGRGGPAGQALRFGLDPTELRGQRETERPCRCQAF